MGQEGRSSLAVVVCGSLIITGLNVWFWSKFNSGLRFYREQRPALCVDGRRMGEPIMQSKVAVDDSKRNKGMITFQCSFAVAVYPCYDNGIDLGEWDGHCRTLATTPAYPEGGWPRRVEDPDLQCCGTDCQTGGNRCSASAWTCASGACTGYAKSLRVCAGKMRSAPYKCFTITDSALVEDESAGFPLRWLTLGIIAAATAMLCCCFGISACSSEENCISKSMIYVGMASVLCGVIWAIIAVARTLQGEADQKGIVESDYKDLVVQQRSSGLAANHTGTVSTEAAPPEGMYWTLAAPFVTGSVFGVLCLGFGCLFILSFFKELGWSARGKAVGAKFEADGDVIRYSVGDRVSLSPTCLEKDRGVLQPGDNGKIVDFVGGDKPIQVTSSAGTCCYDDENLVVIESEGDPTSTISSASVFSNRRSETRQHNRDLCQGKSREELSRIVKTTPGVSLGEKIGHAVLVEAEAARGLVKCFGVGKPKEVPQDPDLEWSSDGSSPRSGVPPPQLEGPREASQISQSGWQGHPLGNDMW